MLAEAEENADNSLDHKQQQQLLPTLDEVGLKRSILALERTINLNNELRTKYSQQPSKFMNSEIQLDAHVRALFAVATTPQLYPVLTNLGTASSLLGLLAHENIDITVDVVSLLNELTDSEVVMNDAQTTSSFIKDLLNNQYPELLTQHLWNLTGEGPHQVECVHNTLGIMESLLDIDPSLSVRLCGGSGGSGGGGGGGGGGGSQRTLLRWLLEHTKTKDYDANKLYASEILSTLLQSPGGGTCLLEQNENDEDFDGVETLMQGLSNYRKKNPVDNSEQECVENLCSALCGAIDDNDQVLDAFLLHQGIELMLKMLNKKMYIYRGALKVLAHAMVVAHGSGGAGGGVTCAKVIEHGGLKVLFPALMGTVKMDVSSSDKTTTTKKSKKHQKIMAITSEEEGMVLNMTSVMILSLSSEPNPGEEHTLQHLIPLKRFLRKFRENEYEKCDRLVELHQKYLMKVVTAETMYLTEQNEDDEDDDSVLDRYRNDAGMRTLRSIALTIGGLCRTSAGLREYLIAKLKEEEERNGVAEIVSVLDSLVAEEEDDERMVGSEEDVAIKAARAKTAAQHILETMRALALA